MPYGHIRQYEELVNEAQAKRMQITRNQKQQIAKSYADIAKEYGAKLSKYDSSTLTYRWVKDYAKSLKSESKTLYKELQGIVGKGIVDTAKAVTGAQESFWGGIVPELSERYRDTLSTVPQSCLEELMSGGVYKDFTGLSERLWNYKQKYDKDISYVINRGIAEQKSAYDLAKDLELYLKPTAKKPWEWRKVYPNCNQVVDYNAQRLSRTSITHAYQMSFQRSTKDNPFIEKYQWHSSNGGRTCDLCRQRDGKLFDKYRIPLDHPNGMCIITAVITKTYDQIANELSDWVNGKDNPTLDQWLAPKISSDMRKMKISIPGKVYKDSGINRNILNEINDAIEKLQEEYAIRLSSISAESMGASDIFAAGPYMDEGVIKFGLVINKDKDYTKVKNKAYDYYESGRFAGQTIGDYIVHEMAHIMVYQGCTTKEEYESLHKIIDKQFISGISKYADATKSGNESLAEAFVRYRNGEDIPVKARILIRAYIERWKK